MGVSIFFRWLVALGLGALLAHLLQGPIVACIGQLLGPPPNPDTASSAPVIRADLLSFLTLLARAAVAAGVAIIVLRVSGRRRARS